MTRQDPVSRAGEDSGDLLIMTGAEVGVPELSRGRHDLGLLPQRPHADPVAWAEHRKLSWVSALGLHLPEPRFCPPLTSRGPTICNAGVDRKPEPS